MKKRTVWGWLFLAIAMMCWAYGNQCLREMQRQQKYGAYAHVNYNVFSAHCADAEYPE